MITVVCFGFRNENRKRKKSLVGSKHLYQEIAKKKEKKRGGEMKITKER